MTDEEYPGGPLDVHTLEVIGRRSAPHPLVVGWAFQPDAMAPRRLELSLAEDQYPASIDAVRLDIRWFTHGDYTFHYLESHGDDRWQCRWDRHPKPSEPTAHFHPPPDASPVVEPSRLESTHYLGILFDILDWIMDRIEQLHETD